MKQGSHMAVYSTLFGYLGSLKVSKSITNLIRWRHCWGIQGYIVRIRNKRSYCNIWHFHSVANVMVCSGLWWFMSWHGLYWFLVILSGLCHGLWWFMTWFVVICGYFRWFKFTLKPPDSLGCGKVWSSIWDTFLWTLLVKFGQNGPWDISYYIFWSFLTCHFLTIPGLFEYFSENGCPQKIKVFSKKERSFRPFAF